MNRIFLFATLLLALALSCSDDEADQIAEVDFQNLLFESYDQQECGDFATIRTGNLLIENNTWNAQNLTQDSFSQCVYHYNQDGLQIMGWEWSYPENAIGVNAYPQLIYGWKPWQSGSTTTTLPRRIGEISTLKANYEVEVERNDGNYNLAFDNWICTSPSAAPENIRFEFMIWEDAHDLNAFGDFQKTVNTSNGSYSFYMGEPDWEPAGSDWTYLAFVRIEGRSTGTVDIDELLAYLVNEGIVSNDHYLASIEFGNEIGNSTGHTIIKSFEIDIQ